MNKKLFKSISISLIALILLGFTFFFVACKNKNENSNNVHPADSIPDSNVFDNITQYLEQYGERYNYNDGSYIYHHFIKGNDSTAETSLLVYTPTENAIRIVAGNKNSVQVEISFIQNIDYSTSNHLLRAIFENESSDICTMTVPSTKYVDLNTKTQLPNKFNNTPALSEEEQAKLIATLSPVLAMGLTEFSNFYANTIKKDSSYIGATYKYFYLPVI